MIDVKNLPDFKLKIQQIAAVERQIPGVIIIHDLTGTVKWMSAMGLKLLGISLEEILDRPSEEYHSRFFNEADANDYVPKILGLLERNNDDEIITYFQQVRYGGDEEWTWHMSSTQIFYRDEQNMPLYIITISFPIDAMHHMVHKASKLLDENNFLQQNFNRYSRLTKREREILKCMALGKSSAETAKELYISLGTVDTHRKNIRKKLETNSYFELSRYARSFDLI